MPVKACWATLIEWATNPACSSTSYVTHSDPAFDPVVVLGLMLLEARPDRMSVLNELFGR